MDMIDGAFYRYVLSTSSLKSLELSSISDSVHSDNAALVENLASLRKSLSLVGRGSLSTSQSYLSDFMIVALHLSWRSLNPRNVTPSVISVLAAVELIMGYISSWTSCRPVKAIPRHMPSL